MGLPEILNFAIEHNACGGQLNKFKKFIDSADELQAWQTVMGNIDWLIRNGLELTYEEVEEKSGGVGRRWYLNGQLGIEKNFKDDKFSNWRRIY